MSITSTASVRFLDSQRNEISSRMYPDVYQAGRYPPSNDGGLILTTISNESSGLGALGAAIDVAKGKWSQLKELLSKAAEAYADFEGGDYLELASDSASIIASLEEMKDWLNGGSWESTNIKVDEKDLKIFYPHPSGLRYIEIIFQADSDDDSFTSPKWTPSSLEYAGIKSYETELIDPHHKLVTFSIDLESLTKSGVYRFLFSNPDLAGLGAVPDSIPLSFFVKEDAFVNTLGFSLTVNLHFSYYYNATYVTSSLFGLPGSLGTVEMAYTSPGEGVFTPDIYVPGRGRNPDETTVHVVVMSGGEISLVNPGGETFYDDNTGHRSDALHIVCGKQIRLLNEALKQPLIVEILPDSDIPGMSFGQSETGHLPGQHRNFEKSEKRTFNVTPSMLPQDGRYHVQFEVIGRSRLGAPEWRVRHKFNLNVVHRRVAITDVEPREGAPGTLIVITGVGFGRPADPDTPGDVSRVQVGDRDVRFRYFRPGRIEFQVDDGEVTSSGRIKVFCVNGMATSPMEFVRLVPEERGGHRD